MAPSDPDYIVLLNNVLSKRHMAHRLTWDFYQEGPLHKAVHTAVAKSTFSHTYALLAAIPHYLFLRLPFFTSSISEADLSSGS
ncbi:unnamed protein product [Peniophora sp. CBMAI 1063]|nr:unnamed protein product [Peniophora sp. CBMAI 1063]